MLMTTYFPFEKLSLINLFFFQCKEFYLLILYIHWLIILVHVMIKTKRKKELFAMYIFNLCCCVFDLTASFNLTILNSSVILFTSWSDGQKLENWPSFSQCPWHPGNSSLIFFQLFSFPFNNATESLVFLLFFFVYFSCVRRRAWGISLSFCSLDDRLEMQDPSTFERKKEEEDIIRQRRGKRWKQTQLEIWR